VAEGERIDEPANKRTEGKRQKVTQRLVTSEVRARGGA